MEEKIVGYILLFAGIAVIIFAGFSVYSVFTKRTQPVELFSFPGISLDLGQVAQVSLPPELKEAGVKIKETPSKKQELISGEMLNQSSNILAHLVLMGFIVNVGFRIATLGTQMTRPVVVKIKPSEKSILLPKKS